VDTASHKAALVDPADADVVIAALKQHSDVTLTHVLTTHKRQQADRETLPLPDAPASPAMLTVYCCRSLLLSASRLGSRAGQRGYQGCLS
jgi:hypothetical protein